MDKAGKSGQHSEFTSQPKTERPVDYSSFVPECEIFEEGGPEAGEIYQTCGCHDDFISVHELTMDHLPEAVRNEATMTRLKSLCDRTVKLKVRYISENRPDTYPGGLVPYPYAQYRKKKIGISGTGFMYAVEPDKIRGEKCPCPGCKTSGDPKLEYFKMAICTAAHVVFDDEEAEKTICEVFFDAPNTDDVKLLYGVRAISDEERRGVLEFDSFTQRSINDFFDMLCVSHDMDFYTVLKSRLNFQFLLPLMPVIVSHPHGFNKRVVFGNHCTILMRFSESYTPDTPNIYRERLEIKTDVDVMSLYPEFFSKHRYAESVYVVLKPLHLFVNHESSFTTMFSWKKDSYVHYVFLPEGSTMKSEDEELEFPVASFQFPIYHLLLSLKLNVTSYNFLYDALTCNGSSGAPVPTTLKYPALSCHFGKENGVNRTGSYKYPWRAKNPR